MDKINTNKSFKKYRRRVRNYFTLPIETSTLKEKTIKRLHLNFEYILLLVASVVISTLGLHMDSSVIVIGGMIVSPLIVPILSMSYGIYDGNVRIMRRSVVILIVSTLITLGVSFLISELSPLRNITDEISSRTNPTLLDLFVALGAGLIGIVALTRHKIADSFAGAAVAVSLVPPLCVAGVGLSFMDMTIFAGGLLLYALNVLAMIFIGTVYLVAQHWLALDKSHISVKALSIVGVSLLLLVLPLSYQLNSYAYSLNVQRDVRRSIEGALGDNYPNSRIDHIDTNVSRVDNRNNVAIVARITIDEKDTISYMMQRDLEAELEDRLSASIQLQLSIQRTVGIISEEQIREERQQSERALDNKRFADIFEESLEMVHPDVSILSVSLSESKDDVGLVASIQLTGEPDDVITPDSLGMIKEDISKEFSRDIKYDITYSPVIHIISESDTGLDTRAISRGLGR